MGIVPHSLSSDSECQKPFTPPLDAIVKMEYEDCDLQVEGSEILLSSVDNGRKVSLQLDFPVPKVKMEIPEDFDALDHIVLIERLRMLINRKLFRSSSGFESSSRGLLENNMEHTVEKVDDESHSVDGKTTITKDQCYEIPEVGLQEHDHLFESRGLTMQFDSHVAQGIMPIKNDSPSTSTCPTSVKVKDEPWDNNDVNNVDKDATGSISVEIPNVKSEWEVHNEYYHDDQVEHMSLIDRLNSIMSGEDTSLNIVASNSSLNKIWPSAFIASSSVSESAEYSGIKRTRKRKKTATDSVQTALDEDAPGLLQALLDKGVSVNEIKLYGESGDDEPLDESLCENSFSELEAVISKMSSQRHSFLKTPITRPTKASRGSYCLACLISLVEQTKSLQIKKWPVEWGWCRDLQSFIFVFERHNRIVLERPEYGYATYFFELIKSLPIEWQIKRLVITMKLTTCSRLSLVENKDLLVGEDLGEAEAKVLTEYGWTPNTGLGTMLNYRDRVVHDRKHERDTSLWKSKIGNMLMDGYNGGTIVLSSIPKKAEEYKCAGSESPVSD